MREAWIALVAGAWLCAAIPAGAADVEVAAKVDRSTVAIDDQAVLSVTVSGGLQSLPPPKMPEIPGFSVYSAGTSRNFSFVNGKLSSSALYRFVLTPRNVGRFTVPPIEVEHGGTVYRTNPITIEVVAAGAAPNASAPGAARGAPPDEPRPRSGGRDLFLRASVDKSEAMVNEQVTLTVRFYQRVRLLESPQYTPPSLTGFWVEDLPPQRTYYETLDGSEYFVTEIRSAIFPTGPGEIKIGAASLICQVQSEDSFFGRGGDPFGLFGRSLLDARTVTLHSDPLTIKALPLPAGAPEGFSGAVGQFSVETSVDRNETTQNEPVTLTVALKGEGNLQGAPEVELPEIPGVRAYDSGSSTDLSKEGYRVRGTRTESKVLVPEAAGSFTVPALSLVYFDTKTRRYAEARSQPISIRVRGDAGAAGTPAARQGIEMTGRDVRYIELVMPKLRRTGDRAGSSGLWLLQIVPLALLAGAGFYRRHRERLGADVAYARGRRAPKEVRRRLHAARTALAAGEVRGFYGEIAHAVTGFVADRLNLPPAGLSPSALDAILRGSGPGEAIADETHDLLERSDLARFSPVPPERAEAKADLARAEALLQRLGRLRLRAPVGAAR